MPVGAGGPGGGGSGWRLPALVIGVVVLMAVAGIVVVLAFHHDAAAAPPADSGVVPDSAVSVGAPPVTPSPDYAGPTTDPNQPRDDASAKAALDNEVVQDKGAVEQLVDHWVPQLSSKRPGMVVAGTTYGYLRIWQDFEQLRGQYPNALLLWSGDYVNFTYPDFYVTVVAAPHSDGQAANQWCDNANIDSNNCYAELLSHSVGPNGTTMLRS